MNRLDHVHHGLHHALHSVAEGWSALKQRASRALTRFTPHESGYEDQPSEEKLIHGTSRWGLLPAEMWEENERIVVAIEIPGMEPDDFEIEIVEGQLTIRGEKRTGHAESIGEHYFLLERAYGFFERTMHLPAEVDQDNVKAHYRHGVLSIFLPKSSRKRSQSVRVTTV